MSEHHPVLLHETLQALAVRPEGCYVDATFGRGGHAAAIVAQLGPTGRLLVADRDPQATASARRQYADDPRVTVVEESFDQLAEYVGAHDMAGQLDGLLMDLGVSSPQLDDPGRGFSFSQDGPLDMRMDPDSGQSAAQWLATAPPGEIAEVIRRYGEQGRAHRIAHAIVTARQEQPLTSTRQLADIVTAAVPYRERKHHPATRVFQAVRIHVNDELGQLQRALESCLPLFARGGRLCVISFHSLEDRIVKRFMRRHSQPDPVWRGLPEIPEHALPRLARPPRARRASQQEIETNPRSRSAVLRVAEVLR